MNETMVETNGVQVASRISKSLFEKIVKRQKRCKALTGFEPSISEVVRTMLEESTRK